MLKTKKKKQAQNYSSFELQIQEWTVDNGTGRGWLMEISSGFRHQWCKAFIIDPPVMPPVFGSCPILFGLKILSVLVSVKKFNAAHRCLRIRNSENTKRGYRSREMGVDESRRGINRIHENRIRRAITKSECELARAGWASSFFLFFSLAGSWRGRGNAW